MPIVSGLVVPDMNPTSHVGIIRLLCPVVVSIERKEDNQAENDYTKDAEEPEERLRIVTKVCSIVFFIALLICITFFCKYIIDFTAVLFILHLICITAPRNIE